MSKKLTPNPEQSGRTYLVNAFSLNMLPLPTNNESDWFFMWVKDLSVGEFCYEVNKHCVVSAVGHQGTVDLVNTLCGSEHVVNRESIKLSMGDCLLVVQVLERLPEGKVLNIDEVLKLLVAGKVKFYHVWVGDVAY